MTCSQGRMDIINWSNTVYAAEYILDFSVSDEGSVYYSGINPEEREEGWQTMWP